MGWAVALSLLAPLIARAETPPPTRVVSGSLAVENKVRVLRVWGKPYDQGFAHGYLLGREIMGLFENVLFDPRVMPEPQFYDAVVRNAFLPRVQLSEDEKAELQGLYEGIRECVGTSGLKLERAQRPLDVQDLLAINCLADWIPTACSSFAAWGDRTVDGGTIAARNLDYFDLPGISSQHLLIVHAAQQKGKKRFASLAWPAIIGVYTAMNEDGVFVAMHDAPAGRAFGATSIVPRSIALRHIVESVKPETAADDALKLLRENPAFRGNNFLVVAPFLKQPNPAVVFEYDGTAGLEGGVTMRTPDCAANQTPAESIACTNHYRQRGEPAFCGRYQTLVDGLKAAVDKKEKYNSHRAFALIAKAGVNTTLQTVVAMPNARAFDVYLGTGDKPATQVEGERFAMADLLKGVPKETAAVTPATQTQP
jgi:hypothetical protein